MSKWIHGWPDRPPAVDDKAVGISFVDVLFALVIGKVLDPFLDAKTISGPGVMHLVLAAILTLTSWVGYHNSLNRPTYFIRFPNLPLFQFLLDIAMVVAYWLTAVSAERATNQVVDAPSAIPEALFIALSFVLYVAWDYVSNSIRHDDRYERRPISHEVPARRYVTLACCLFAIVLFVVVRFNDSHSARTVYLVDALLIVLLIAFRLLKEYVTPPEAGVPTGSPSDPPPRPVRLSVDVSVSSEDAEVDEIRVRGPESDKPK